MNGAPDLVHAQRELGLRGGLHRFIRMAWHVVRPGTPFKDNWSIGAAAEHLEAVHRRQIRRLIINQPPGTMKSLTVCVFWPVWAWIQDPTAGWFFTSFDSDLTHRDANYALQLVNSEWFRARWGDRVRIKGRDPAIGYYETVQGGMRLATSIGGKGVGRHPDHQVIDDPTKPQGVNKDSLAKTKRDVDEVLGARWRDLATGTRTLIMQRLHEDDLAGQYMADGGYQVVRLPMRYESANPCVTVLGKVDPRTEEGELLWPERFPDAELRDIEKLGESFVSSQLQQRPAPAGGATFKEGWFGYWVTKTSPTAHLTEAGLRWRIIPERFDTELLSWDMTFKETSKSDFVVGQHWGRSGAESFLTDQWRDRADFPRTLQAFKDFATAHPKALVKLVEDKANGPAVIATLKSTIPGIIAVNPEGGKEARANAVAPLFEAGNVFIPDPKMDPKAFAWVKPLVGEFVGFPFAKNDDSVDTATQALNYMLNPAAMFVAAMRALQGKS